MNGNLNLEKQNFYIDLNLNQNHHQQKKEIPNLIKIENDYYMFEFYSKMNFKEIISKIEDFFIEFLQEIECQEKSAPQISILDLEKIAIFNFEYGYYSLPENINDENFTILTMKKNLERITRIINILSILYVKISQNSRTSKRELYYNDVELFKGTNYIDSILLDVCSILNVNRFDLCVFPAQKGLFAGVFEIYDIKGNLLCFNSNYNFEKINLITQNFFCEFSIRTNAKCVLIVEKETIFHNIISHEDFKRIFNLEFIVVTGKGYSDYLTKFFLKRLSICLPYLKFFYFGDLDAYGLEIYLNYIFGSKKSARENHLLCVNNIYWLGLTYEIIENYLKSFEGINDLKSLIQLTTEDYRKIDNMLKDNKTYFYIENWCNSGNPYEDFILANIMKIKDQLNLMILKGYRAEAELIISRNMEILIQSILSSENY